MTLKSTGVNVCKDITFIIICSKTLSCFMKIVSKRILNGNVEPTRTAKQYHSVLIIMLSH